MRIRDFRRTPEEVAHAQSLEPGMRVRFVGDARPHAGRVGVIQRAGSRVNTQDFIALWLVTFEDIGGPYCCWHDELELVL